MIKKTVLIIFVSILVLSCGKKGDPEYKESKKEKNIELHLISKV